MSQPTTGILLNSTNPAPPDGNQNVKPQSDGAIPLQSVTFYPQPATDALLGVVKPDGTTILVGPDGTLSSNTAGAPDFITAVQQQLYVFAEDTGEANAYVVTQTPPPVIVIGSKVVFVATHANTGPSTLTIDSSPVSTAPITKEGVMPLTGGEIENGQIIEAVFDGTNFQIVGGGSNSIGTGGSGGGSGSGLGDVIPAGAIDGTNVIFTIPGDGSAGPGSGDASPIRGWAVAAAADDATITLTLPDGTEAGDLAIVFASTSIGQSLPSGWTSLYEYTSLSWAVLACSKVLDGGDISTGSVSVSNVLGFHYDKHGGMVVFVGATGGVRETEGQYGIGSSSAETILTNSASGAVENTDVGVYWATDRTDGSPAVPVITPDAGSVDTLSSPTTANAASTLATQNMPGGALAVNNHFGAGGGESGEIAVQVIVQTAGGGGGSGGGGGARGNLYLNGVLQDPLKVDPDYTIVGTTITMRNPPVASPSPDSLLWVYLSGSVGPPGPAGGGITTLVGDVTAGPGVGTVNATLAASGVSAGTYEKVTVDAKGRVTSGDALSAGDIPNIAESQVVGLTSDLAAIDAAIAAITIPTAVSEVPSGTKNGVNTAFTLAHAPSPAASLSVYRNGVWQDTNWVSLSGLTITFISAPRSTDKIRALYTH